MTDYMYKRNTTMARNILSGQSYEAVGKSEFVCHERARQVLYKVLRSAVKLTPLGTLGTPLPTVRELRENKGYWIGLIDRMDADRLHD